MLPKRSIVLKCLWLVILFSLGLFSCGMPEFPNTAELTEDIRSGIVRTMTEMVQTYYPFEQEKTGAQTASFTAALEGLLSDLSLADAEFKDGLRKAAALLSDGHSTVSWYPFGFMPGIRLRKLSGPGYDGIYVERCAGRPDIGVRQGDKLISIAGQDVSELFQQVLPFVYASSGYAREQIAANYIFSAALRTLPESSRSQPVYAVVLRGGTAQNIEITFSDDDTYFLFQNPYFCRVPESEGTVGYIYLPTCGYLDDIDTIDQWINTLMGTKALILDLRGNGGGSSAVADYILGRFIASKEDPFPMKDKAGRTSGSIAPFPRGEQYTGRLYVITDYLTFSAANYLASRVRYGIDTGTLPAACLVGERSGGGSGVPVSKRLTENLTFRVSRYVIRAPGGSSFEAGTPADIPVFESATPEQLSQGFWSLPSAGGTDAEHDLALRFILSEEGYPQ